MSDVDFLSFGAPWRLRARRKRCLRADRPVLTRSIPVDKVVRPVVTRAFPTLEALNPVHDVRNPVQDALIPALEALNPVHNALIPLLQQAEGFEEGARWANHARDRRSKAREGAVNASCAPGSHGEGGGTRV
jgi:hypothetical protein